MIKNVIPMKLVSAKAGNQLETGFLFSQGTLDSCLRRNDDPGRAGWHKLFIGITH